MANRLMCRMSPLSRPVSKRTMRRKSLIAGNKKGPLRLPTQSNEPVIPCTSDIDVSGLSSSRSPGEKANDFLRSLMKKKDTASPQQQDGDNPHCSNEGIFLKPAATKRKKHSPRVLKRRNSMPAFLSPGKTLLSKSMHGLDKIHRHRTVSMTTVDMGKLEEAIENQKRKRKRAEGVNNESLSIGPDTSIGTDVTGSSSSSGVDADLFLADLNKTQDSSRNIEDDDDQHRSDASYLKSSEDQPKEISGCKKRTLALKSPRIRKRRRSLPPGQRLLSRPMRGSSKFNQCSIPMTKLDMNNLQDAIDLSQIREKRTSDKITTPQNPPDTSKSSRENSRERVYAALDKVKQSKELRSLKRKHRAQEQEVNISNTPSTPKQKEKEESAMPPSSFEVLGQSGKTPDLDFSRLDEMYKKRFDPSQVLNEPELNMDTVARFLSFQDGQDADLQMSCPREEKRSVNPSQQGSETEVNMDTLARFISIQDGQDDSMNSSPPSIQRRAFARDIIDPESEVSDTTVDEANETILEKEIRSFFESKRQHSPQDFRDVVLALDVAPSCIQHGTDDGGSESEVISAGQKMPSQTAPEDDDDDVMVIDEDGHYSTSESHIGIEDLQKLVENTRFSTTDSAGDHEDLQKPARVNHLDKPDKVKSLEDLQKLAKDTSGTCSQRKVAGDIILEGDVNEQIVPGSEDKLHTLSQQCKAKTSKDHAKTVTRHEFSDSVDVDMGGMLDDGHPPFFHSTPADLPLHPEPYTKKVPKEILSAWEEIEKEKKTFVLFCHKDAAPYILEDFQSCDDIIDAGSLSLRSLNDRTSMVVQGKVLDDGHFTSSIRNSPKRKRKDAPKETKKGKKKKKMDKKSKKEKKKMMEKKSNKEKKKMMEKKSNKEKKSKKEKKKTMEKKRKTEKKKKLEKKEEKKNIEKKEKKKKKTKKTKLENEMKVTGAARKENESRWERELNKESKSLWSGIDVQPSMESDMSMLRCLRETARTTLKQREKGHIIKDRDFEADHPDLMTFVDLVSLPDVFITKKRDRPRFCRVPSSEIHSLQCS